MDGPQLPADKRPEGLGEGARTRRHFGVVTALAPATLREPLLLRLRFPYGPPASSGRRAGTTTARTASRC